MYQTDHPQPAKESLPTMYGLWQGTYQGIERLWLRWYDANGNRIPTPVEQESQKAEGLAAKLRELGIDPNQI
ncbi:hypothetical protein IQ244_03830 [Nostoc sp. LEGE 06077]|uniref:hypothetical protein n=1 Tax=Nostoc sp. LEGE 06077 TaxID=915325 RepID=UPI00187E9059|nr:hypothetical protein [Nostoc sp. LEGE 06077]MBE9205653.1 hypothetical protein [Nostoc sp. LEGE 06077]